CTGTCTNMGTLTNTSASPTDPLAKLDPFTNPYSSCAAGAGTALTPGCYTSIPSTVLTLASGRYYITGTVNIGNLSGTNVFLYLAPGAQLVAANNKSLTLSAEATGAYAGVAIFQDRTNSNNFSTGNNFTLAVSGALYFPDVDVDFANSLNFTLTSCT